MFINLVFCFFSLSLPLKDPAIGNKQMRDRVAHAVVPASSAH